MNDWQIQFDDNAAVFRRPLKSRVWWALGILVFSSVVFAPVLADAPPHQSFFLSYFSLHTFSVYSFQKAFSRDGIVFITLGLFLVPLLGVMAGPQETRFDFQKRRYSRLVGFFFVPWTKTGDFSEIASLRLWQSRGFEGLSIEWKKGNPYQSKFIPCSNSEGKYELAGRLAAKIGVPVLNLDAPAG